MIKLCPLQSFWLKNDKSAFHFNLFRVTHHESGRSLEVYSNQPGVQFYTSNFIPEDPKYYNGDPRKLQTLVGKDVNYYKHGAFCLETQNYPDAINHVSY